MTSPDQYIPPNAYGVGSTSSMQDVTQADVAAVANGDIKSTLNQLGLSWVQNLLGGFSNVVQTIGAAINQLIQDIVYGIKGITGGLIDLTGILRDSSNNATNSGITAGVAQNVAAVAQGTATTAQNSANTAQTTANGAQTSANTANTNINTTVSGITQTTDPYQVAPVIEGITEQAQSNATAIAVITANQNGQANSGVSVTHTFNTNANPITGFTQYTAGANTPIIASSGQARLLDETLTSGKRVARCNTPTTTSDQSVVIVTGQNNLGLFFDTSIIVRSNSTMSQFVYLNIFRNHLYLGNGNAHTGTFNVNDWADYTIPSNFNPGTTIEVTVIGNNYRVYINGQQVIAYTDSTYPAVFNDGTHKYAGFALRAGESVYLDSWSLSDLSPADTVGTGWNLYRADSGSSASVSWPSNTSAPASASGLGSDTFDFQDKLANVLLNSLGLGRIKIVKAGWYSVSAHVRANLAINYGGVALLGGTNTGAMTPVGLGQVGPESIDTTWPRMFGGSWVVYCPVDYYLQPAVFRQQSGGQSSSGFTGDATGTFTNFSGALMNG